MKKVLSAIALALFLSLPAAAPAQVPDGWIKKLEDGGFLIKNKPVIITHCNMPLLLLIPRPEANSFVIYDGPALRNKAREVIGGKYLTFNVAPIMGIDCNAPDKEKPKKKKFYRSISR